MKTFAARMSKRPSDTFTRFTSTTPHAVQRPSTTFTYQPASRPSRASPSPSSSSPQQPSPSSSQPPNETPLERVARLRAAHQAAKESASYSAVDRLIETGRRMADRAHRVTAYGLILLAGLSTAVTVYGGFSLVAHTRREKRAFVERELDRLDEARRAFLRGDASAEQLHLLEQERAGQEMEAARMVAAERKKSESYWSRVKGMVGAQAAKGEMGEESAAEKEQREARLARRQKSSSAADSWVEGEIQPVAVPVAPSGIAGVGLDSKGRPVPVDRVEYVSQKSKDERPTGGPLDVLADNAATKVTSSTEGRSWMGWLRGSKS